MPPKRKAEEAVAAERRQEPPIFASCRMVFWAGSSSALLQKRVQQLGAVVQPGIVAEGPEATTHVICPAVPALTSKLAATKLQAYQGPAVETRVADGAVLRLPPHVSFVLLDWAAKSIGRKALQPAADYLPPCLRPAPAREEPEATPEPELAAGAAATVTAEAGAPPGAEDAAAAQPASSVATVQLSEQEQWAAEQDVMQAAPAAQQPASQDHGEQGAGEQRELAPRVRCRVVRRGAEFVAVEGVKPQYTGGDTGIPFGSFGVWDEPHDPHAARETVDKLRNFWFQKKGAPQQQQQPSSGPKAPKQLNSVCAHACCGKRPYCVVAELQKAKQAYQTGSRTDDFKLKRLNITVSQLIQWGEALDTEEDVRRMGLTKKSEEKVVEIVSTGHCSRADGAAASEQVQVLNLFQQIWGVGAAIARKWYDLGLRSVEDVRRRAEELHLSQQQRVSLKFFDDLAQRLPRREVAVAEAVVREVCFDLVERSGAGDVELTFCCATGSYRRGQADSSDIDILTCLPPSMAGASCGAFMADLLGLLLSRGLLMDEMSPRAAPHEFIEGGSHASWMGLCRVQGGPARRIDVKVYPPHATPFAINYFSSSQAFCRATRFWATHAAPSVQHAQRVAPAATGFKLSDQDLLPIAKPARGQRSGPGSSSGPQRPGGSDSEGEQHGVLVTGSPGGGRARWGGRHKADAPPVVGPAVPCADETAIFRALGLAFVPSHMRAFPEFA